MGDALDETMEGEENEEEASKEVLAQILDEIGVNLGTQVCDLFVAINTACGCSKQFSQGREG